MHDMSAPPFCSRPSLALYLLADLPIPILQPTDRYLPTHLEMVREGAPVHRLQADPAEVHAAVHALHLHPPTDQDITGDRSVSQSLRSKQHAGWLAGCFEP